MPRLSLILMLLPGLLWAGEQSELEAQLADGRQRFETYCGACHSLELPRSQRLDRATWAWVISDMVEKFGAVWLTEEDQALILDYLVAAYGPQS